MDQSTRSRAFREDDALTDFCVEFWNLQTLEGCPNCLANDRSHDHPTRNKRGPKPRLEHPGLLHEVDDFLARPHVEGAWLNRNHNDV